MTATGAEPIVQHSIARELAFAAAVFAAAATFGAWHIRLVRQGPQVFTPYDHNFATPALAFGLALGTLTVLGYGLCRRVSSPAIGLIAAFAIMTSPLQLYTLPSLEHDYVKSIFIVAAALILSFVVAHLTSSRRLVYLAASGGLVLGVGFYFRQDVVLHAAVFAGALLLLPAKPALIQVKTRLIAVLVFSMTFGVTRTIVKEGANALSFGPVAAYAGLLTPLDAGMAVSRPVYDAGYKWIDQYVFAMPSAHASLVHGVSRPANSLPAIARDSVEFVIDVDAVTPADVLVRAYASTVQVLDIPFRYVLAPPGVPPAIRVLYGWRGAIAEAPVGTGAVMVGAALAIVAAGDLWLATVLLGIVLYVGGYPSLHYQGRHFFHAELVTWIAFCYLLRQLLRVLRESARPEWRRTTRAALFTGAAFALLVLPLLGLRIYQTAHLRSLFAEYVAAPALALEVTRTSIANDRLLIADPSLLPAPPAGEVDAAFLIAAFDARRCDGRAITTVIRYDYEPRLEAPGRRQDFSRTIRLHLEQREGDLRELMFIALAGREAYGWFGQKGYTRFAGLEMSLSDSACFSGLRRVTDTTGFPVVLDAQTPEAGSPLFQQFVPWEISDPSPPASGVNDPELTGLHYSGHITNMSISTYTANERYYSYGDPPDIATTSEASRARGDRLFLEGRLGTGGFTLHLLRGGRSEAEVVVTAPGRFRAVLEVPEDGSYAVGVSSNVDGFTSLEERFVIERAIWNRRHR